MLLSYDPSQKVHSPSSLAVMLPYCETCPSQGGDKTAPYRGQLMRWTGLQDVYTAVDWLINHANTD